MKREARKGLVESEDLAIGEDFIVVTRAEDDDMSLLLVDSTTKWAGPKMADADVDLPKTAFKKI